MPLDVRRNLKWFVLCLVYNVQTNVCTVQTLQIMLSADTVNPAEGGKNSEDDINRKA